MMFLSFSFSYLSFLMKNPQCGPVNCIGGFSFLFCPFGVCFVDVLLAPEGEGDAAGEELGGGQLIPGAVFVVAHQGKATGGELDPDLV